MSTPEIPVIEGLSEDQVRTLMNCRTLAQYTSNITDYQNGKCSFCDPLDEKNKVLKTCGSWRIWKNPYALKNTRLHLIMAPIHHVTTITESNLPYHEMRDATDLLIWALDNFDIPGGGLVMRMGSPKFTTGSILHLHANIIVPDGNGAVQVTLAKEPKKIEETVERMHVFEKLRRGEQLGSLTIDEQVLVAGRLD